MRAELMGTAFSLVVDVILLFTIWRLYKRHLLDLFRENLFAIREEMFLYSADAGLLDAPAYTELRSIINGLIRFGHKISLFHVYSRLAISRAINFDLSANNQVLSWRKSLEELEKSQANVYLIFHMREMGAVLVFMIYRFIALGLVFDVYLLVRRFRKYQKDKNIQLIVEAVGRKNFELLESEALSSAI